MREITLEVEPSAQAPRLSRGHLKTLQDELGVRFNDVALVVSELVTNSVVYGSNSARISVMVATSEERIRIQVTDSGPCFDKNAPRFNGMGLDIVEGIVDRWGVESDEGCKVWAEMSKGG